MNCNGADYSFGGSASAPTAGVRACQWNNAPLKNSFAARNHSGSRTKSVTLIFVYSRVKFSISSNISRITKVFVFFFGGLRPRPSKIFGFVGGFQRDLFPSADSMSANPQVGRAILRKKFLEASAAKRCSMIIGNSPKSLLHKLFSYDII